MPGTVRATRRPTHTQADDAYSGPRADVPASAAIFPMKQSDQYGILPRGVSIRPKVGFSNCLRERLAGALKQ